MTDDPDYINGPWRSEGWEGLVVNDNDGFTVLACPGCGNERTLEELKARSRLIAAAPDMVAALRAAETALLTHGINGAPRHAVRAAIAKAEGRK